jgi:HEAT repeat protein
VFVRPAGTGHDAAFAWFASGDPRLRLAAAEIATERAPGDPRTLAALTDRLRNDPNPMVRKLIASRMLVLLTERPGVTAALHAAAAGDDDTGVRWAARYALREAALNFPS